MVKNQILFISDYLGPSLLLIIVREGVHRFFFKIHGHEDFLRKIGEFWRRKMISSWCQHDQHIDH